MRIGNVVGIKTGIRFIFKPVDTAAWIRKALIRQSYSGRLVTRFEEPIASLNS
jgi:hypothetical protein